MIEMFWGIKESIFIYAGFLEEMISEWKSTSVGKVEHEDVKEGAYWANEELLGA